MNKTLNKLSNYNSKCSCPRLAVGQAIYRAYFISSKRRCHCEEGVPIKSGRLTKQSHWITTPACHLSGRGLRPRFGGVICENL
ncbi:MAG: hypothetical protein V1833_01500 [Elusimicrobiota bacterium]